MSRVIGVTSGITTGKSTVSKLLTIYGFKIIDADIASREAAKKGFKDLEQVKETFGEGAIDENGEMNRQYAGEIVFNHPDLREAPNEIVRPIIREIMEREKNNYLEHGYRVIMGIPLLCKNGLQDTIDEIRVVYTFEGVQTGRLMERDNLSLEDAETRVYSQVSIDEKSRMADHVIDDLGDKLELKQSLQKLFEEEGYIQSGSE